EGVRGRADERRITASGYSPCGAGALSGVSGVCRAANPPRQAGRCRCGEVTVLTHAKRGMDRLEPL
ncbi:hypothetical protein FA424_17390, partial [Pseudomonas aeruginosa]|nr:hypothetical protein [Pseudomonas aeruginosa]